MVTPSQQRALPARPASGRWWLCLLTAALFVFHVTYVRIHLFTEAHHSCSAAVATQPANHSYAHQHGDDHEHDKHSPHPATDHHVQLAGKQQCPLLSLTFLLPETSLFLTLPKPFVVYSTFEHGSRPGESPPDPLQPRAPPLA